MESARWALVTLIGLSVLIIGILLLASWRRRRSPLGRTFFLFALLVAFYTFGYMCELASDTLPAIRFWLRIESVGIAFLPAAWVTLAVYHTRAQNARWAHIKAVLLMLSAITFVLSNTSEFHHLHYGPLRLNPDAPFPVVAFEPGPWYWVHTVYINLAVLYGNILYARAWRNAPPAKSKQAFVFFLGSLFPWGVYIAYLMKAVPWGIDPHPAAFLVPAVLYAWAAFGLGMLEIVPLARQEIFQMLSDSILVFDREGRLADFNLAAGRTFPFLTEQAKGKRGSGLFQEHVAMQHFLDGSADEQTMYIKVDGERINYQLQRIELYDGQGEDAGFIVVLRDVTRFSTIVEGLRLQASIDPLTKAWNRTRWKKVGRELVGHARRSNAPISLILIDLDDFKIVNDTHGHLSGDSVLADFARICRGNLRAEDIFGRYGGDEFVIILPGVDKAGAAALAERLRQAVEAMGSAYGDAMVPVTASFGVITPVSGEEFSLDDLIRKADMKMYEAKNAGGNRVYVHK
ncbi:histidine kinase N-terminal 7TM domain-containing protein [Anaeroselena agilis]|uniref:Histidine kinase N-terminal 7TM domain-containing protein n=1 Tax=Anaeroselena agilis TaxID=3063788 RepID=A0ABU3P2D7_9FIRM|nr:histidine kinase N-terminal 7TM domain-containing protein [Selenomonadales bacterium 4137-cl]